MTCVAVHGPVTCVVCPRVCAVRVSGCALQCAETVSADTVCVRPRSACSHTTVLRWSLVPSRLGLAPYSLATMVEATSYKYRTAQPLTDRQEIGQQNLSMHLSVLRASVL